MLLELFTKSQHKKILKKYSLWEAAGSGNTFPQLPVASLATESKAKENSNKMDVHVKYNLSYFQPTKKLKWFH